MVKWIYLIAFLCLTNVSSSQIDSTWMISLNLNYANESIPQNGSQFKETTFAAICKDSSNTIVPSISRKSLFNSIGLQYGLSYYKSWAKGYGHVATFFSDSDIYPKWVWQANAYYSIISSVELNLGAKRIDFSRNSGEWITQFGLTSYYGSYYANAQLDRVQNGSTAKRIIARKYLRSDLDYIQLGYYSGIIDESNLLTLSNVITTNSYQIAMYKQLYQSLHGHISISRLEAEVEGQKSTYTSFSIGLTVVL